MRGSPYPLLAQKGRWAGEENQMEREALGCIPGQHFRGVSQQYEASPCHSSTGSVPVSCLTSRDSSDPQHTPPHGPQAPAWGKGAGASAGTCWYQSIPSRCRALDLRIIFCSLCRTYEFIPRNGAGRSETGRMLQVFLSFPSSSKKVRVSGLNNKSHSNKTVQCPFPCQDGNIPPQPGGTTHSLAGLSD